MNKFTKFVACLICLSMFAAMAIGSGSTSSTSSPTKVGEVASTTSAVSTTPEATAEPAETETATATETPAEAATETPAETEAVTETPTEETPTEEKTEFHVGDILEVDGLQIVYAASGEYTEDNQFMQPADGNKIIYIKLAVANNGDSDESISSFLFECYADGYSAEQHYTDNDLSATLSPSRTTEGLIAFEVPQDAQQIEIEYEINMFTDEKVKFIYDGEQDSGYAVATNTEASENAFVVGDIIEADGLTISYLSCENDTSYSEWFAPEAGYHYITLTFDFENTGTDDQFVSYFDFDCYADGQNCESAYFRDDALSATISSGRKAQGTVTFTVPDGATTVEVEYVANIFTSERAVFAVSE